MGSKRWVCLLMVAGSLLLSCARSTPMVETEPAALAGLPAPAVVDSFDEVAAWSAHPADGVRLDLGPDAGSKGGALRLDFDFQGGGGYAVARKEFSLDLPENYVFTFKVRGQARPNHIEFKLIDATGENVWWSVRRDLEFTGAWQTIRLKKRHISFAWGPLGGGEIRHVAAIEFAITAGSGGAGTVWLDELELAPLPPPGTPLPPPVAVASSARAGESAIHVLDQDPITAWAPDPGDGAPWIRLDFGGLREYGGLVVDWAPDRSASAYTVEASDDGTRWRALAEVTQGNGGRDYHYLPESESRYLRLRVSEESADPAIRELTVEPLEWAASREVFFENLAGDAPRGSYPRAIGGEQSFWTVVGVDGDPHEALLNEDGMIETGKGSFSVEPFLFYKNRLITWADASLEQSLEDGYIPIPTVAWNLEDLGLSITAFAVGLPGESAVIARYRLANPGTAPISTILYLALRPFQVNPPSQTLNAPGGVAPIHKIAWDGETVRVDERDAVICLKAPDRFGAAAFERGDIVVDYLRRGEIPDTDRVRRFLRGGVGGAGLPFGGSSRGRGRGAHPHSASSGFPHTSGRAWR